MDLEPLILIGIFMQLLKIALIVATLGKTLLKPKIMVVAQGVHGGRKKYQLEPTVTLRTFHRRDC